MRQDGYSFKSDDVNPLKPQEKSISTILGTTRRVDDALLHALSLVLTSNTEYARSVSALLETDMNRDQTFNEINSQSKDLLEQAQLLISSQEQLKELLISLSKEHKEVMELLIAGHLTDQKQYMDKQFSTLFVSAGLLQDGSKRHTTARIAFKAKKLLAHDIWFMALGAFIYHLATLAVQYFGGN